MCGTNESTAVERDREDGCEDITNERQRRQIERAVDCTDRKRGRQWIQIDIARGRTRRLM